MPFTNIKAEDDEDSPIPPAERAAAASRSTWVSVGVNVVLSTTQIVVGVLSKSQGLIADGKHCLADLVSDFVVLLANHASQKLTRYVASFFAQRARCAFTFRRSFSSSLATRFSRVRSAGSNPFFFAAFAERVNVWVFAEKQKV